jgi:hypothetical protein
MLLFCRNSPPPKDHHFHFVTPIRENNLSSRGLFRLDYKAAETVAARTVIEKPWILKALAVGTMLDVDVIDSLPNCSLRDFWEASDLYSGEGYNLSPKRKQRSAKHLFELKDFEAPNTGFSIRPDELSTWLARRKRQTAHFPRSERLYAPPLVIIPKAPGESVTEPKAFLSLEEPLAFSKSNYGFSAAGVEQGDVLACALYLAAHSSLYRYFCLMRSSLQGASYRIFLKEDLEAFPFPDPRSLPKSHRRRIIDLARALETDATKPWGEIDGFIFTLYGLDEHDADVVRDTVEFCGPYQSSRERAEDPVPPEELLSFCRYLEDMLQPLFGIAGQKVSAKVEQQTTRDWFPAWQFVFVTLEGDELRDAQRLLTRLMVEASKTGATRIIIRVPDGGLLLGILNQRRFWTRSRARLCSLHIEQHHMDAFPISMQ